MPPIPYPITGTVKDSRNNILASVEVLIKNTTQGSNPLVTTTDSDGKYSEDLANFNTGYTIGDSVSVEAFNSFKDEYSKVTFTISGVSKTQNLTLEVISALQKGTAGQPIQNILVNVNSIPYTKENPLPIKKTSDFDFDFIKAYSYLDSNPSVVEYTGYAVPGSSKSSAVWAIKKFTYSGTSITDEQWAKGNTNFDKEWNIRTSYEYS